MDRWTEIELFVQTAELGSLSRAAEAVGLSNAAASRHLASLEARLGAQLVQRNTRRLALTELGESYYGRCKTILADLRDADATVNATALDPMGTLRVTASLSFAMQHIAPLLRAYTERYPKVTVHVEAANRYLDLIDNNIDVAIRTREYESDSGILVQPKYILYEDIVAGRLVPVLDDWDLPRLRINIAFQSRRHMSAKVRTFIDFLVAHFERMDYERKWTSFDAVAGGEGGAAQPGGAPS